MPLWMQLLIQGGILQQENNGEGSDLGGGSGGEGGEDNGEGGEGGDNGGQKKPDQDQDPAKKGNKPSDKEAELLKEVMKRKGNEQALKSELDALKAKFGDLDPEVARELIREKQESETKKLEEKGQFDLIKKQMNEQHKAETDTLKAEINALKEAKLSSEARIDELTVGSTFSQSKYVADELTLTPTKARALYATHFDLEDGQIVGYNKPRGAAGRTQLVDVSGEPLTFDLAMQKIIEADPDRDSLIRSKIHKGSGSNSKQNPTPPKQDANLSPREKIAQGLKTLS